MDRRDLVKILGIGLVVGPEGLTAHDHAVGNAAPDVAGYRPRFLTGEEYRVLGQLCDIIMPADESSPGARSAGVPFYIDSVLFYAKPDEQQVWRAGLAEVQAAAKARSGHGFEQCDGREQESVVVEMASNEGAARTPLEEFFGPLKKMILSSYWLSDVGMRQYLGYRGDAMLKEFRGCTHPEHQAIGPQT